VRLVLSYDVPSTSLFVLLSIHSYSQCPKLYNSSPIFATLHLRTVYIGLTFLDSLSKIILLSRAGNNKNVCITNIINISNNNRIEYFLILLL
ncbi:MAG: hypothetical protein LN588_02460, partial [Rickettsia endosymbiont of Bryobia graminum]|nr:hypothetical protein [Rickettsia endosymbiont of Bryobia graminum]